MFSSEQSPVGAVAADGDTEELIAVTGDTSSGYAGKLAIGVA